MVALLGVHPTQLRAPALESFVLDLLAVVALFRPHPKLEYSSTFS
jgi:hypothetical protein